MKNLSNSMHCQFKKCVIYMWHHYALYNIAEYMMKPFCNDYPANIVS